MEDGPKIFYIDIKTIDHVKKLTMFQGKMADFKGKKRSNHKDKERTILHVSLELLFLYEHMCNAISTSVLMCI